MNLSMAPTPRRRVFCVLSARSLVYAKGAMESLVRHSLDDIDLTLITDTSEDRFVLIDAMQSLQVSQRHRWMVCEQSEADARAAEMLRPYPKLAGFRFGHPCWRKITDPMLFVSPGEEMIILDPDLYFPNQFHFEPTPIHGLLLMHQPPSCLLPHEVVTLAYENGIPLAHHVDIGVAQARNAFDLSWLDWLIGRLGGATLPRMMHVEAIVWAALAMREGGGYLDPTHWHCWRNPQWKRLLRRLGASGQTLLRVEDFKRMKCFHGGGIAKWWIPDAIKEGRLPAPRQLLESREIKPFVELTQGRYRRTQRLKDWARRAGYYRLEKSRTAVGEQKAAPRSATAPNEAPCRSEAEFPVDRVTGGMNVDPGRRASAESKTVVESVDTLESAG